MFAATPIFDALADEILDPGGDFAPQVLMTRCREHLQLPPVGRPRHELPRSEARPLHPRGALPPVPRRPH